MPDGIRQHPEMEKCAHLCHACQDACLGLIPHCLALGAEHADARHIGLLVDCSVICGAAHNYLHRGSPLHGVTCRACAEVCEKCAEDCERIGAGDERMRECAAACLACAEACRMNAS